MQKCRSCGTDLPENARFCGNCGNVQDATTINSNTLSSQSWAPESGTITASLPPTSNDLAQGSMSAWSSNTQASGMPPPSSTTENADEDRSGVAPLPPLYDAPLIGDVLLSSGQASPPGAPMVPGTPQIGNVPTGTGTPTLSTNIPVSHPGLGTGNIASVTHPSQGSGTTLNHPSQGPGTTLNHPSQGSGTTLNHPSQVSGTTLNHPTQVPQTKPELLRQQGSHQLIKTNVIGGSTVKTILVVVAAVVVVGGGGIAAATRFFSHPPQPLISVTSQYKVGNTPAGADGTSLHISGKNFSSNSAMTVLLDGHVAPGNQGAHSDANGSFNADVTITNAWSVGSHTLTARDADNNNPQKGISITILQPGQGNTPGPNGAPPDDASFTVIDQIQGQTWTETEIVTGHPDPMGGTVCHPGDNGQPITYNSVTFDTHIPYKETATFSCTGSYKGGQLTLTETLTSDVAVFSRPDGTKSTCTLNSPQIDEQVSGNYIGNNTFDGTITYPLVPTSDFSCDNNGYYYYRYAQYTWTGQVSDLHV